MDSYRHSGGSGIPRSAGARRGDWRVLGGATIQGDYLVRGAVAGPEIMMAPEPEHQHGFAFLRHSAIDQHINTRNRWDDMAPVMRKYPDLLGSDFRRAPRLW